MREQQQRYRVIDRLAAGGMAEVFRAESAGVEGFKKKVAIKRVLPHLSEKKKFIRMFLDEARLGAHLSHSNCVQVFDIGVGDNTYFIVMEYVDGADLKNAIEWMRKVGQRFPVEQAVYIAIRICEGLSYAHELTDENGKPLQIVHRDMSPPNVLITKYGEIKIADFGLAKASSQLEKSEPGIIKGKFSYLSPEAAMGQEVDLRTDIFAVGLILWEMITGQKLFQGDTDFETVKLVQRAEIPSISRINPAVSPELEAIINKSLARDERLRFQTARDFGYALTKWLFESKSVVSAYEIADLIKIVVSDRHKEKRDAGTVNIIDKLIEQTLFEFTSLQTDGSSSSTNNKSPSNAQGADLGKTGSFIDIQDWGSELSDLVGPTAAGTRAAAPPKTIEGNLAALEDDEPIRTFHRSSPNTISAVPSSSGPSSLTPSAAEKLSAPSPSKPSVATGAPAIPTKTSSSFILLLVMILIAIAGLAGAYFGGLFR